MSQSLGCCLFQIHVLPVGRYKLDSSVCLDDQCKLEESYLHRLQRWFQAEHTLSICLTCAFFLQTYFGQTEQCVEFWFIHSEGQISGAVLNFLECLRTQFPHVKVDLNNAQSILFKEDDMIFWSSAKILGVGIQKRTVCLDVHKFPFLLVTSKDALCDIISSYTSSLCAVPRGKTQHCLLLARRLPASASQGPSCW